MSSADYYLTNQGTGAISTYRVNFTDTDIQIYEADGITPNATGWVSSPWWVGVFDGLLYVVSDSIAGAVALPSEVVITITDDGLLLYYGFTSAVIGVTDESFGWWREPITSIAWWSLPKTSVAWWRNISSSIGLWVSAFSSIGWWKDVQSVGWWRQINSSVGWWNPINSTGWWKTSPTSIGWWINSRSSVGLWATKSSVGWWNAQQTSVGWWKDGK